MYWLYHVNICRKMGQWRYRPRPGKISSLFSLHFPSRECSARLEACAARVARRRKKGTGAKKIIRSLVKTLLFFLRRHLFFPVAKCQIYPINLTGVPGRGNRVRIRCGTHHLPGDKKHPTSRTSTPTRNSECPEFLGLIIDRLRRRNAIAGGTIPPRDRQNLARIFRIFFYIFIFFGFFEIFGPDVLALEVCSAAHPMRCHIVYMLRACTPVLSVSERCHSVLTFNSTL